MAATDGFSESGSDFRTRLQNWLPKIVLAPSFAIMVIFVYGFIAFTIYLSFTGSRMLPSYDWVGWQNYDRLFRIRQWDTSVVNLAIFASLYIVISTIIGLMLAIFLDQKIRGEGVLRPIFLYPMALSFIVTGHGVEMDAGPRHRVRGHAAGSGGGRASASTGSRTARWRSTRS
jgi:glucose/mannose transport system permease protein